MRSPLAHLVLAYLCRQHEYFAAARDRGRDWAQAFGSVLALPAAAGMGWLMRCQILSGMGGTCGTRRGRSDGGAENNRLREDRAGMARGL